MSERKNEGISVAVVRFPGSNCDDDTFRYFQQAGHSVSYLWHKDSRTPQADLLVLPGGFAFGDRVYERATGHFHIDPGVQALKSPVMEVVEAWVKDGRPILGVCNGFQILTHAGLLPGVLQRNDSDRFFCDDVQLKVGGLSFFGDQSMVGKIYTLNVAHGYGRYTIDEEGYKSLVENDQIFLRYEGFNPNGSLDNIAGITNEQGNVIGMMPHPERGSTQVREVFMQAIEKYVKR